MRETREKRIGPYTYKVTHLDASAGTRMGVRLLKMLGPTAAGFLEGAAGAKTDGEGSLAVGAAQALREIAALAQPDEYMAFMKELAHCTVVVLDSEHQPRLDDIFDDHFAGHYDWLREWFRFALEVNFSSFFGGAGKLAGVLSQLQALIASTSKSQATSTGPSTESPQAGTTEAQA